MLHSTNLTNEWPYVYDIHKEGKGILHVAVMMKLQRMLIVMMTEPLFHWNSFIERITSVIWQWKEGQVTRTSLIHDDNEWTSVDDWRCHWREGLRSVHQVSLSGGQSLIIWGAVQCSQCIDCTSEQWWYNYCASCSTLIRLEWFGVVTVTISFQNRTVRWAVENYTMNMKREDLFDMNSISSAPTTASGLIIDILSWPWEHSVWMWPQIRSSQGTASDYHTVLM